MYISSCVTLNETFTAECNGVLPGTPYLRPKSKIYTPKLDEEHIGPFHMQVLPGYGPCFCGL